MVGGIGGIFIIGLVSGLVIGGWLEGVWFGAGVAWGDYVVGSGFGV